ncbi:hypothetical protein ABZ351_37575, partial [Streptomyces microflavus]
MSDTETANRLPTAEEEARFWGLVEAAWERLGPEPAALRRALLTRDRAADDDSVYAIDGWLDAFLDQLGQLCADLSGPELTALDRVVERKLYDIDRADVHAVIDGSDDGFLYGRGHVVALGRRSSPCPGGSRRATPRSGRPGPPRRTPARAPPRGPG